VTHATQTLPNGSPNTKQMLNTLVFRFLTMGFASPDFCSYGGKDLEIVVRHTVKICQLHNYDGQSKSSRKCGIAL